MSKQNSNPVIPGSRFSVGWLSQGWGLDLDVPAIFEIPYSRQDSRDWRESPFLSSSEVFIHQLTRMKLMSNHLTKCIQLLERTDPSILVHTEELDEDGEVDDNLPAHPYDYKKFVSDWEALISLWRNSWNKVDIEKMVKERNG